MKRFLQSLHLLEKLGSCLVRIRLSDMRRDGSAPKYLVLHVIVVRAYDQVGRVAADGAVTGVPDKPIAGLLLVSDHPCHAVRSSYLAGGQPELAVETFPTAAADPVPAFVWLATVNIAPEPLDPFLAEARLD